MRRGSGSGTCGGAFPGLRRVCGRRERGGWADVCPPLIRSPTCATASSRLLAAPGLPVPVVPRQRSTARPGRRRQPPRPPRRHGRLPRRAGAATALVRNHEINGPGVPISIDRPPPTTRRPAAARPRSWSTRQGNVIDSDRALAGTQMNCSGGPHALVILGHLRGDGQRPRRLRRLHVWPRATHDLRPERGADPDARLHLRGAVSPVSPATAQPIRSAGRFAHESVAVRPHAPPCSSSPRTTSGSRPASTSTCHPGHPRLARLADRRRRRALHARRRRAGPTRPVGAFGGPTRVPDTWAAASPIRPHRSRCAVASPPRSTTAAICRGRPPGLGAGRGVLQPARGLDLRPRTGRTSPRPRAGASPRAPTSPSRARRVRNGLRPDLGLRHADTCLPSSSTSRRAATSSTSPTT